MGTEARITCGEETSTRLSVLRYPDCFLVIPAPGGDERGGGCGAAANHVAVASRGGGTL